MDIRAEVDRKDDISKKGVNAEMTTDSGEWNRKTC